MLSSKIPICFFFFCSFYFSVKNLFLSIQENLTSLRVVITTKQMLRLLIPSQGWVCWLPSPLENWSDFPSSLYALLWDFGWYPGQFAYYKTLVPIKSLCRSLLSAVLWRSLWICVLADTVPCPLRCSSLGPFLGRCVHAAHVHQVLTWELSGSSYCSSLLQASALPRRVRYKALSVHKAQGGLGPMLVHAQAFSNPLLFRILPTFSGFKGSSHMFLKVFQPPGCLAVSRGQVDLSGEIAREKKGQ